MAARHPIATRQKAFRLREAGHEYNEISRRTGVSKTTLSRWFNPEHNARQLAAALKSKHNKRRNCAKCGTKIWYTSTLCAKCAVPPRQWPPERVIKAIQDWAATHNGEPPTSKDWYFSTEDHPAATTVYGSNGVFRFWNDAIEQAGFTPRPTSPGPGHITWDVDEARRMRQQGITDAEIGRRMGVTGGAINQKLGNRGETRPRKLEKRGREQRINDLRKALEYQ